MNERELVWFAKALAAPLRVRILTLLRDRALCVNALAKRLKVTQGAVSQHLRVLREAGIVLAEKRGYYVRYGLDEERLVAWRKELDRLLPSKRGTRTRRKGGMCCHNDRKKNCQKPENLKGRPEDCTPEQIRECHGDIEEHPCPPKNDSCRRKEDN